MANKGFIVINRKIEDSAIWNSNEQFCKRAAWIDLILMANHMDKTIVIGNQSLTIKRGEKFTSVRKLSVKWNWTPRRTLEYLKLLEDLGMIYRNKMLNGTLITIVNYGKYQDLRNTNSNTTDNTNDNTNDSTIDSTADNTNDSQTTMINNDKTMNKTIKQKPSARLDGYE